MLFYNQNVKIMKKLFINELYGMKIKLRGSYGI